MRYWGSQLYMPHALSPYLLERYFYTAFLADNALVLHPLVFAAKALVIFRGPKDTSAKKSVSLRLKCSVIDSLRFFNLSE